MNLFTSEYDERKVFGCIVAPMLRERDDSQDTASVERFKALWRRAIDGHTGDPMPRVGVTEDGRYGYRYDSEGRFYAVLLEESNAPELPLANFPA